MSPKKMSPKKCHQKKMSPKKKVPKKKSRIKTWITEEVYLVSWFGYGSHGWLPELWQTSTRTSSTQDLNCHKSGSRLRLLAILAESWCHPKPAIAVVNSFTSFNPLFDPTMSSSDSILQPPIDGCLGFQTTSPRQSCMFQNSQIVFWKVSSHRGWVKSYDSPSDTFTRYHVKIQDRQKFRNDVV